MPRLLYTYLVNQVLAPFYASLVILTGILFLSRIIPLLDLILDYNISLPDFIRLFAYITPQLMLFALPMASMIGVILGAVRLVNDRELMIMNSCGISFYQMLTPIIVFALCTSLLSGFISIYLIPKSNTAKAELLFKLARAKIENNIQEKQFSGSMGNLVLYVDEVDQKNNLWHGIYISDMRKKHNPLIILAHSGTVTQSTQQGFISLDLNDGSLHRNNGKTVDSIHFKSYRLNLPMVEPEKNPLAKLGRTAMTQSQLLKKADIVGRGTKAGAQLLQEYHIRLVIPVGCFILTILGFSLGLITGPGQRAIGVPFGLFALIFYHILLIAGDALGTSNLAPPGISMWLPDAIFLIIAFIFIRGAAKESFIRHFDTIFALLHNISLKLNWHSRK